MLLKAKERLENVERLESLLRNRRSLLIYWGLESLEVEPNDPSEAPVFDLAMV